MAIYAIVAISLLVLTGWAGHISLGQFALVGFGGATTAVLYGRHGWDFFLALPAGALVAARGRRAHRPSRVAHPRAVPRGDDARLRGDGGDLPPPAAVLPVVHREADHPSRPLRTDCRSTQDWQQYYFCLAALIVVMLVVRNLRRSRTGRVIIAVRDNEMAAEAATMNATRVKLLAFGISGALAGFAGGLYVVNQQGVFSDAFSADVSLRLFSMVVIGGLGSMPGAVLGAVYVRGAEFFLPAAWELLASGVRHPHPSAVPARGSGRTRVPRPRRVPAAGSPAGASWSFRVSLPTSV